MQAFFVSLISIVHQANGVLESKLLILPAWAEYRGL